MGAETSRLQQHACLLQSSTAVTDSDLSRRAIFDQSLPQFAEGLGANQVLTTLSLSRNLIRDDGALCLASTLIQNDKLENLDLSWNAIGSRGAIAIAQALISNRRLRSLNLFGNRIGDAGGMAIEAAVDATSSAGALDKIDIGFNGVRDGVIRRLQRKLAVKRRYKNGNAGASSTRSTYLAGMRPATARQ